MGSWLFRGIVAAVVIVVAAGAGWWFFIRSDAQLATAPPAFKDTPADAASATPASGATSTATTSDGTPPTAAAADITASDGYTLYLVVPEDSSAEGQTEAAYFAGETLARLGVPSTAKGTTAEVSGSFSLGPDGLDPAVQSTIVVTLADIRSDESRRDGRMRDALEVSKYPQATFVATSVGGWPGEIPEGQDVKLTVTGTMDLHGVQKELTWDVIARRQGDVITALATVTFLYADFDIPVLDIGGFVSVEDNVTLQVQLIATAQ